MEIKTGYLYHIKNEYFDVVNDENLMQNHEKGKKRPTYFTIKDKELEENNLLPTMSINDDECKGYVLVKKAYDNYEYDAYIKCKNYTTVDYQE